MLKTYPDEFLTRVLPECTEPVSQDIVDLMMDVAYETECLGLAASQLGIPYRIIVVFKRLMVNPVILQSSNKLILIEEGCLSLPGEVHKVLRHEGVIVEWQTPDLKETKRQGWLGSYAYVAQHEIDHLNGKLISENV